MQVVRHFKHIVDALNMAFTAEAPAWPELKSLLADSKRSLKSVNDCEDSDSAICNAAAALARVTHRLMLLSAKHADELATIAAGYCEAVILTQAFLFAPPESDAASDAPSLSAILLAIAHRVFVLHGEEPGPLGSVNSILGELYKRPEDVDIVGFHRLVAPAVLQGFRQGRNIIRSQMAVLMQKGIGCSSNPARLRVSKPQHQDIADIYISHGAIHTLHTFRQSQESGKATMMAVLATLKERDASNAADGFSKASSANSGALDASKHPAERTSRAVGSQNTSTAAAASHPAPGSPLNTHNCAAGATPHPHAVSKAAPSSSAAAASSPEMLTPSRLGMMRPNSTGSSPGSVRPQSAANAAAATIPPATPGPSRLGLHSPFLTESPGSSNPPPSFIAAVAAKVAAASAMSPAAVKDILKAATSASDEVRPSPEADNARPADDDAKVPAPEPKPTKRQNNVPPSPSNKAVEVKLQKQVQALEQDKRELANKVNKAKKQQQVSGQRLSTNVHVFSAVDQKVVVLHIIDDILTATYTCIIRCNKFGHLFTCRLWRRTFKPPKQVWSTSERYPAHRCRR